MAANRSTIYIEVEVDGQGGIKVLRQIGTEAEKTGQKGKKSFQEMNRSVASMNQRFASTQALLLRLGAIAGTVAGAVVIARKLKGIIDVASDLNETISKSRAIFGNQATAVEKWASTSATSIGMSTQAALEHTATLGNMFQQLGAGTETAAGLSQQMVKLAADLASFHNVAGGASAVLDAMASAFRGEYDALQRYIPTINAAAVQQQALAMTGAKTAKELTNLEKALAAQAIMMRDAGAALGDFQRTSNDLANQERILTAQLENQKALLGRHLLPAYLDIVREANAWIEANDAMIKQKVPEYIERARRALEEIWGLISSHPDIIHFGLIGLAVYGKTGLLAGIGLSHASEIYKTYAEIIKLAVAGKVSIQQSLAAAGALATQDVARLKSILKEIEGPTRHKIGPETPYRRLPPIELAPAAPAKIREPVDFDRELMMMEDVSAAEVREYEKEMTEFMERQLEKRIQLERDWLTGAREALDNYTKAAIDAATNAEYAFQKAMWSMEDALVDFVKTGKVEFSELLRYIAAEMARAPIRQFITGPLSGWLSVALGGIPALATPSPPATFQQGGWIREPVMGRGLRSGRLYGIGEAGPELVLPGHKIQRGGPIINQVRVINESGVPLNAEISEARFDGEKYVTDVHIDRLINNRSYRQANRQAFRGI